ncbi:MAG TPA: hypothetical protein VIX73_34595 [Kofleriaceae bacterium]
MSGSAAAWLLDREARALLTRLARVKPFALQEPMLPAAALSARAQTAIEDYLGGARRDLRRRIVAYRAWLASPAGRWAAPEQQHRRYVALRLGFNLMLGHVDLFSDAITQRSEHEIGLWLAGLEVAAGDALAVPGAISDPPPVVCYLDRGPGGAIRRARTRLPGGGDNPVAIIRIPRERMIGSGVASSLVHEVGHQAAALLDLVASLRRELAARVRTGDPVWSLWQRWLSEIVADLWAVARIGVASTLGLMGVVSVPRRFQFQIRSDDPHPAPWIRVKLSCRFGAALYPHPQWRELAALWDAFYPIAGLGLAERRLLGALHATLPELVALLTGHRPAALRGASLGEALTATERRPDALAAAFERIRGDPAQLATLPPSLAFAMIGQACFDGRMTPEAESRVLAALLAHWALSSTIAEGRMRAAQRPPGLSAAA